MRSPRANSRCLTYLLIPERLLTLRRNLRRTTPKHRSRSSGHGRTGLTTSSQSFSEIVATSSSHPFSDLLGTATLVVSFTTTRGLPKMTNQSNNPMQPERLASAPRCFARTRRGAECQSPAVKGKRRCRMHGGTNPGAPKGNRNAYKHGGRSAATLEAARYLKEIARLLG